MDSGTAAILKYGKAMAEGWWTVGLMDWMVSAVFLLMDQGWKMSGWDGFSGAEAISFGFMTTAKNRNTLT